MNIHSSRAFPSTIWADVELADLQGSDAGVAAMNRFVASYWRPLYYFIRAKGYPSHRAEDLTQEFILQLTQRDWLRRADPRRGRLRNYILRILTRFLSDQSPARLPRQQAFERKFVEVSTLITDDDRCFEPPAGQTADEIFDQRWAASVVQSVLVLLKESYEAQDRGSWYELFAEGSTRQPGDRPPTQHELATRFRITRDKVRYARQQVQTRFQQLLAAEVQCQVGDAVNVDAEVREILQLAQRGGGRDPDHQAGD